MAFKVQTTLSDGGSWSPTILDSHPSHALLPGRYFSSFLLHIQYLSLCPRYYLGIFFCSLFYLLKCNRFRLENLDISCLVLQAEIWRGELKTKNKKLKVFPPKIFATREIGYGDLACFASDNNFTEICKQRCICEFFRKSDLHQTKFSGKIFSFRSEEDCNNGCTWQHTGLGLDYQVLSI